jgi:hypothetical protein
VTCDEARELIGADPETASPELLAQLATCPDCQAYREQMLALNAKIRRALELDLQPLQRVAPPGAPPANPSSDPSNLTVLPRRAQAPAPRRPRLRGLPIAASLAAAVLISLTLWLSRPGESLATEVVTHVEGEPNSWSKTQPVTPARLDAVLRKSGVKLGPGMQPIVYANSCYFRGHFVPHFVVMTADGPVTVMILLKERVTAEQQFSEDGYSGVLVPAGAGSVAVISRTPMSLEQPASDVVRALQSANN